jgi:Fic family protein
MLKQKLAFDFTTTQLIIQKIARIEQFRGEWKQVDHDENRYLKELRRIATIESIGSSTRIEGSTLTDAEVATLLRNLKVARLERRDEQEVVGYYDTLETILDNYANIDLTVSNMHALHSLLLKYTGKDVRQRGRFKEVANQIVATYPDGTIRTIFTPTEPFLVEKEMQESLDWVQSTLESGAVHPLLVIALFIYEFLSIHPYHDGNGRLSRLLTNLLLLKTGYKFVVYISLEHVVEHRKKAYYQALMDGQKDRRTPTENVAPWVIFFLDSLLELIDRLDRKLVEFRRLGGYLNERQKRLVEYISVHAPMKSSDLVLAFPEINPETLKKDLQYLVRELAVERLGQGRGTVYIVKNPPTPL